MCVQPAEFICMYVCIHTHICENTHDNNKRKEAMNLRVERKQVGFEEGYLGVAGDKKMSRESGIILFQLKKPLKISI